MDELKKLSLLYVEDEEDVMEEISEILELKVGKLYTATNGKEALEIYKNNTIDILVTDISMPIMDGMELISCIREENIDIPIVITTAFNEIEILKKAIDLSVDKYITKPIDLKQLFSVIKRASLTIFQKREIEQRDKIIQKMLEMKPYYSILVDSKNLQKLDNEIFSNLSWKKDAELILQYKGHL
ncbi:MAG: response regulator [Campylobacterales bacterium]|nr:response regulator [Campylobacterales bacterium]